MSDISPNLEQSWYLALKEEFSKAYFSSLKSFLIREKQAGHLLFPPGHLIFNAFEMTPLNEVKVVIIGQDPYHGPGQAHGLSFSVPIDVPIPPSLLNIYKELNQSLQVPIPKHGNLESWARQGVLLLNSILTVRAHQAASHHRQGWELFTDAVIQELNEHHSGLVFILWGRYAQNKGSFIDRNKHLVLTSVHPSPLSAHRGFLGCGHFKSANEYLQKNGKKPVNWDLNSVPK